MTFYLYDYTYIDFLIVNYYVQPELCFSFMINVFYINFLDIHMVYTFLILMAMLHFIEWHSLLHTAYPPSPLAGITASIHKRILMCQ